MKNKIVSKNKLNKENFLGLLERLKKSLVKTHYDGQKSAGGDGDIKKAEEYVDKVFNEFNERYEILFPEDKKSKYDMMNEK